MLEPNQIVFFDTTLRDGEQSPGCTMHHDEKLRLAHQLRDLGVDIIEAGFAIASEGDFHAVQTIAREVKGTRIASLARCKREDIEAAGRAVQPAASNRVHVFLASSDLHLEAKLKITREQALDQTAESVRFARTFVDDVEFSTEDGTRTDPEFLVKMITVAVQAGASTINIPDTVGYTTPAEYEAIFRMVKQRVPGIENVVLSAHCHDDLGMAVANSLAAIQGGARQVECTITGIGERAGNAALEEIAAAIMVRRDRFPYTHHIKMDQLYPTSKLLAEFISFGVSPNKAVVGANAFAHESGIHQHGVLANPLTYEIMTPESVGVAHTNLVLGKHSGRRALADRLEKLGYGLTREQLDDVYHRFTELADRKKAIYDQDILGLLQPNKSIPVETVP
ncbi:2-isopropylmalate synthase [Edaphobacter bradus]|uniref:2-isopropylmalate synthase n=1 Tax=Edaphobacter bradus TaxID=2259016 RepID=UPI0021E0A9D6|nr:2-isopropylmalate synthase [Edaphobacter bradus]